jgi:hypothetical protein
MDWVIFWTLALQFVIGASLLLIVGVVAFAAVAGVRERNDARAAEDELESAEWERGKAGRL